MQQHYDMNGIPSDNCSDFALQLSRLMKSYGKSTSEVCEMLGYPMEATPRYDIVQPYIHSQPPYEFIWFDKYKQLNEFSFTVSCIEEYACMHYLISLKLTWLMNLLIDNLCRLETILDISNFEDARICHILW